jgi:hypothetical protein
VAKPFVRPTRLEPTKSRVGLKTDEGLAAAGERVADRAGNSDGDAGGVGISVAGGVVGGQSSRGHA